MHHFSRARFRRSLPAAVLGALLSTAIVVAIGHSAADGLGYSPQVDAPSAYEAQTTCTTSPRPGTVALARWLQKTYPATGSMGMMRACRSGGTSEHKDGRAFDWAADVSRPRTRRAAYGFIRRALATDAAGNPHALARRLGIMYIIYDDTIWSSYRDFAPRPYLNSGCSSKKKCSRTLRHLNHVHISLGYAGAAAQTSWYRARGVTSQPVLDAGTTDLNADETAVTGMTTPSNGTTGTSSFQLKAGVTYRIVATGTVTYAPGLSGDANCTWPTGTTTLTPTDRGLTIDPNPVDGGGGDAGDGGGFGDFGGFGRLLWGHQNDVEGSTHAQSPYSTAALTTHGLLLHGALRWEQGTCRADHTYEAWYRPLVDERLQLRYFDLDLRPNAGNFTVYVARDDITRSSLAG